MEILVRKYIIGIGLSNTPSLNAPTRGISSAGMGEGTIEAPGTNEVCAGNILQIPRRNEPAQQNINNLKGRAKYGQTKR